MDLAILEIPTASVPAGATEAELACDQMPVAGTSVLAFGHRGDCPSQHHAASFQGWRGFIPIR